MHESSSGRGSFACLAFFRLTVPRRVNAWPVRPRPRRQHAVHHVDPALYGSDDVVGLSDAHEVAWLVAREHCRRMIEHVEHRVLAFSDGQAANRIPIESHGHERLGAFLPQLPVEASLLDSEQRMSRSFSERGL